MLRTLLSQRFRPGLDSDTEDMRVYALTAGKNGSRSPGAGSLEGGSRQSWPLRGRRPHLTLPDPLILFVGDGAEIA